MNDAHDNAAADQAMLEKARFTETCRQVQARNAEQVEGKLKAALKALQESQEIVHHIDELYEREDVLPPAGTSVRLARLAREVAEYATGIERQV
jgi:hypothetical protein